MKKAEFEQMKEKWLRSHFAEVASKPAEGGIVSAVPLLFRSVYYEPRTKSELSRHSRDRFILTPVEAKGGDIRESLSALFDEIVMDPRSWAYGLDLYLPKTGQNPDEAIKVGEPMVVVRHDDPEHEHGSPRLIDFAAIDVLPVSRGIVLFEKGSLDGQHSHFLIR